jgi:hypothetical protein
MNVYSDFTIPHFGLHVTIFRKSAKYALKFKGIKITLETE